MLMLADYKFLYLLLLIPVVLVGYAVLRYLRSRRVKAFGDPELTEALMPSRSRSKGWVRLAFWCLAFAFFAVGLARPRSGAKLAEHTTRGAEIIVALDVSNSMLAQDYSPTAWSAPNWPSPASRTNSRTTASAWSSLPELPLCSCPSPRTM